ncbi:MAG: ferrous iron transport protein B [Bacteroidetes bacterium]|nr:ferrous iron transport protein B [Bacteroidota bacterium]MDA1121904.1 ferrous iron transport protein B [Bacteroidota bacterium]
MKISKVALVGNPNSGKTSVFNLLTGLNQHVGNYPGVTVDKKVGHMTLATDHKVSITDLPGTYSIYPRSDDEQVVIDLLNNPDHPDYPEVIIVVVDSANLEHNLLLFTQIYDLRIPVILALNMSDVAQRRGVEIDKLKLSEMFGGINVIQLNSRKGTGFDDLKKLLLDFKTSDSFYPFYSENSEAVLSNLDDPSAQILETEQRFKKIRKYLNFIEKKSYTASKSLSRKVDKVLIHPIAGYIIFLGILFSIFQTIYSVAEVPMELIDSVFFSSSHWLKEHLPSGVLTNLLAEGIIPGLGGVVIFVPQIALLFLFIVVLEETGYMSRVVFIMDKLMRPFGLNGKSVVPLISGVACAIPAIMATRTIHHWKDRLITIMVTPLMSCSARLPVYTLLIALVIPDVLILEIFNLKGIVLLGLYVLGLVSALLVAGVFKFLLKTDEKSYLVMEMPGYKLPYFKNILYTILEKSSIFVWQAGKIIMAISIILWVLASYGPGNKMEEAVSRVELPNNPTDQDDYESEVNSARLSNSWIGHLGHVIEPGIAPLGYDWKIGISLITSFAAREIFVGSMATIYSVEQDFNDGSSLIERMRSEINPATGLPVYTLASGISLMVFYVFAMQCMSTLAIVYRETKSWKWPFIQTVYMTTLAYLSALLAYNIFN